VTINKVQSFFFFGRHRQSLDLPDEGVRISSHQVGPADIRTVSRADRSTELSHITADAGNAFRCFAPFYYTSVKSLHSRFELLGK